MSVSKSLKKLAESLEQNADSVLAEAEGDPALFAAVAEVVANSVLHLERAAEKFRGTEPEVSVETLETIAQLASALDESDDEKLQKKAELLDELLVTISAPKNAVTQAKARNEKELNRLREEYRAKAREDLYKQRGERLDNMHEKQAVRDKVKNQVKDFRPMEAPLQSRYCPDHPGVGMIRVADRVFQCALDKKIYNYEAGYTTQKGNRIPGTSVERQVHDWGEYEPGHAVFDTRQNMMSRFASDDKTKGS